MSAAAAAARLSSPMSLPTSWARQGTETLASALRIMSDLTAQEVALVVRVARERISLRPIVSAAEAITASSTEAGKILLDLAAGQNAILTDAVKEGMRLGPRASALVDLVSWGGNTAIDLMKRSLEEVSGNAEAVFASYMAAMPMRPGSRLMNMARSGVIAFIEAEKAFLDELSDQVAIVTEPGKEGKTARGSRSKVLAQLARDAVDKYTQAQKQLAEVAIDRFETGTRRKAQPRTPLSEVARDGVQKFAAAQKSLLDLALKKMPEPAAMDRRSRRGEADSVAEARAAARETARRTARTVAREEAREAAEREASRAARAATRRTRAVARDEARQVGREAGRAAGRTAGRAAARATVATELENLSD